MCTASALSPTLCALFLRQEWPERAARTLPALLRRPGRWRLLVDKGGVFTYMVNSCTVQKALCADTVPM